MAGEQPFVEWLQGLKDRQARTRIEARIARIAVGNLGDTGPVGEGVLELRIDWGSGYRVCFARTAGGSAPLRRRQEDAAKGH